MSKVKKIYIEVGVGCILLTILLFLVFNTSTIRMEGTINYKEDKVEIVFSPFEAGKPTSLESSDEYLASYAKLHNGEKIECDVQIITLIDSRICLIKKVYYEYIN